VSAGYARRVGCTVGEAEGLDYPVVPHQEDANPQVRSTGEIPRGRILGAIIVCSGETFCWRGLQAGAVRATVERRRVKTVGHNSGR